MQTSSKKAFTMVELVFVIVVIGILAAIAVPKFAATRDDAQITKGLATLASVRSALSTQRQKLILRGEFGEIVKLRSGSTGNFTNFVYKDSTNNDVNGSLVLEYDVESCTDRIGCWSTSNGAIYTFKAVSGDCQYTLSGSRFDEVSGGAGCVDMK